MPDDPDAWAAALGLEPDRAAAFARLAADMGLNAPALLRVMIARVAEADRDMHRHSLGGLGDWAAIDAGGRGAAAWFVANYVLGGLPLDIRPTQFMWPADVPFPWSAEECRAAVIGYEVKWRGSFDDFPNRLRGLWEMSDGYAVLRQP